MDHVVPIHHKVLFSQLHWHAGTGFPGFPDRWHHIVRQLRSEPLQELVREIASVG